MIGPKTGSVDCLLESMHLNYLILIVLYFGLQHNVSSSKFLAPFMPTSGKTLNIVQLSFWGQSQGKTILITKVNKLKLSLTNLYAGFKAENTFSINFQDYPYLTPDFTKYYRSQKLAFFSWQQTIFGA